MAISIAAAQFSYLQLQHYHHHRHRKYFAYPKQCCLQIARPRRFPLRASLTPVACNAASDTAKFTSEDKKEQQASTAVAPLRLTYLEGNSWLLGMLGLQILVDPILVGNLDFGIPWLYDASKKELKEFQLKDLPDIDLLIITQNFDDHCHIQTLEPLSKIFPDLQVISTPNAEPILSKLFKKVIYLEPGDSTSFASKGSELSIRASAGPVLGPPWQRPENGYFVKAKDPAFSVYFEPHCVYDGSMLEQESADVVITPVVKQVLPGFTLVSGQSDAVNLVKLLKAKVVVPMQNGDLEAKGVLAKIVSSVGTVEEFKNMLQKDLPGVQVLDVKPGIPTDVPVGKILA